MKNDSLTPEIPYNWKKTWLSEINPSLIFLEKKNIFELKKNDYIKKNKVTMKKK